MKTRIEITRRVSARTAVLVLMVFSLNACAMFNPIGLLSLSARYLVDKDMGTAETPSAISVEELLVHARGGTAAAEDGGTMPLRMVFYLEPSSDGLDTEQLTEAMGRLDDAGRGHLVIAIGPGFAASASEAAYDGIRRARAVSRQLAAFHDGSRLRFDPRMNPGEIRIERDPARSAGNA